MPLITIASLFLFALAPLPVGLWQPGEPVMVALVAVSGIAVLFTRRWSPVLWPLTSLIGLTILLAPFQPIPLRSWLGTPELGIGGAWFAAWAILAAGMLALDRVQFGAVVVFAGIVILLELLIAPGLFRTLNDWTAFVSFAVAAQGSWFGLAVAAALIAASGSKGAMVLAAGLLGLWAWRWSIPAWLRLAGTVACPVAVTVATFLVPFPSLQSRALLWQAVGRAMWADPWLLLHGIGWGSYDDMLLSVLPGVEQASPIWEAGVASGHVSAFSAHSLYVEALSALGVPGLLAMLAAVAVPAWYCEDRRALSGWIGIAGLLAIWHPLPQCVPFMAYALCRCSRA